MPGAIDRLTAKIDRSRGPRFLLIYVDKESWNENYISYTTNSESMHTLHISTFITLSTRFT
jgi:hypothetical protein